MANKQVFERKHFFINRGFQGKYMVSFLIPMLVMLIFMLFALYIASQGLTSTTSRIIKEDIENTIVGKLQDKPNPPVSLYESILEDIRDYLRTFSANPKYRKALFNSLLWVLGAGIFILIVQIVLLTIFISHKVAGPVYRFEQICHRVIDGDYSVDIKLRKGDEMQNLAHLLENVVHVTRERLLTLRDEKDKEKRKEFLASLKL